MAWQLEIHHIDVAQGDATLIVVREVAPFLNAAAPIIRSVLIDGGKLNKGADVHQYLNTTVNLNNLDIMIATHYDGDHYNGLRYLLQRNTHIYDNTIIFDQGEQGNITVKRRRDGTDNTTILNQESDYLRYLDAIQSRGARNRITQQVNSQKGGAGGWRNPYWLVNKEVLWYGFAGGVPAGAPIMTCIAANQYIRNAGAANPVQSGQSVDPKNEKSLAFLVQFNNFKYYLGGDIETTQEDHIMTNLNPNDDDAGRILAMKASHHGSDRSTSANFVNRLRPSAAFISCGYNNSFEHPRQEVLNNLEHCVNLQYYYLTEDRDDTAFNARVGAVGGPAPNIAAAYTPKAFVAGSWGPPDDAAPNKQGGNIVLRVTEDQSNQLPNGVLLLGQSRFTVTGYSADSVAASPFNNAHT
ncbi:ComEC/Rec2 family competence protein [Microcystis aeruginosa]|uniref:Metallo-beta-lactamase domain-containing protein n=1 Tax=Microcystis aeruginosa FD4 TaxID=2686288 RepID=A0A857DAZ1_MICAE|nr:hypothetical protein [Microcystis aeruginosa]QGZ92300.1 hypothetical protein GQR42_25180 [Microcystis aeruginosa FD4]